MSWLTGKPDAVKNDLLFIGFNQVSELARWSRVFRGGSKTTQKLTNRCFCRVGRRISDALRAVRAKAFEYLMPIRSKKLSSVVRATAAPQSHPTPTTTVRSCLIPRAVLVSSRLQTLRRWSGFEDSR